MLVTRVAYQDGRKLAEIGHDEVPACLARPDCFVWVAMRDCSHDELLDLQELFDLPELAVEDAHHGDQRPKIEEYGDTLFVVLNTIEVTDGELQVGQLSVFVDRNYVVSVRAHSPKGFKDVRTRCEREPELLRNGPGYVLYALMDAVVDRYFPVLDAIENELEVLEERIFAGTAPRANIEGLYYVRQKLMTLKHALGPLLESVSKLLGGRVPHACAGLNDYYRDIYDHLVRLNASIDSIRDTVNTAISVNLAMITIAESEVTKRLAAYGALVAVPTMIAGIYGMNFQNMPELKWAFGYPTALAVMTVLDVWLWWRFRKANWL